jgi:hypothetical protein
MGRCPGGRALAAAVMVFCMTAAAGAAERLETVVADDQGFLSESEIVSTAWDGGELDAAPRWTIWAGAIFLQRDNPDGQSLVFDGADELLNAGDLEFGTQAGPDLNAIRHGELFDVDFRYFHVHNMTAHERIFPPGAVDLNLATPFSVDCPQLDASYVTNIQSVEVNLRKNLSPNVTVLAGFRYIALNDNLGHEFDIFNDAFDLFTLRVFGINRLYGAQTGVDANLWTAGRFQLQSALKVGVYGNDARNQIRLRTLGVLDTSIGTREQQTAFVGDWNFTGVFQLTDVWAIRGGYQLLWLSGVALASEQFTLADILSPGIRIDTSGELFLHGALVSLQAGW